MARYHAPQPTLEAGAVITDTLESIAREGARRMLERMLEEEVDAFLGRPRYAPGGRRTGYRNGYGREREVGIGHVVGAGAPAPGVGPATGQRALRVLHPAQAPLPLDGDPAPLRPALPWKA